MKQKQNWLLWKSLLSLSRERTMHNDCFHGDKPSWW